MFVIKKENNSGSEEILQQLKCSVSLYKTSFVTDQYQAKLVCD